MDVKLLFQTFFEGAAVITSGPGLVAGMLARLTYAALQEIGFDPAQALAQLAKLGFKLSEALAPELTEAAKAGVRSLTQWFEKRLGSVEVNEAAGKVLVEQAEPIAAAAAAALPDGDKAAVAETVKAGLAHYGGATAVIAEPYAEVIKDVSRLNELLAVMRQQTEAWARQTVEAKRGSLIENVEQTIEGGVGGTQEVRAEDDSSISGVKQVIRGGKKA